MEEKIKLLLDQLYAIKDDDKYYFMTYGREWIKNLIDEKPRKEKGKKTYKINIDDKPFVWNDQFITGSELKELVEIPRPQRERYGVWLKCKELKGDDKSVADGEWVDLAQPDRVNYYTGNKMVTEG